MEISNKQLHKHAVPVVIFSAGLLLATLLIFSSSPVTQLSRALVTPIIKVQHTSNGLARVSINQATVQSKGFGSAGFNQMGRSINLSLSVQSLSK